jgi:hypothetical protein
MPKVLSIGPDDPRRNPDCGCAIWYILENDGIRSDAGMISDHHPPQDFGSCSYIYVSPQNRRPRYWTTPNSDLLEYETVCTYFCMWMYDDAVRMRQEQSSAEVATERDVCPGYDAPKAML